MEDYILKLIEKNERNKKIYKSYKSGKPIAELGREYGVTRQRILYIIQKEEKKEKHLTNK